MTRPRFCHYCSSSRDECTSAEAETCANNTRSTTNQLKSWKAVAERAGICMTCALGPPDPYGCTDCLNTGWAQGAPPGYVKEEPLNDRPYMPGCVTPGDSNLPIITGAYVVGSVNDLSSWEDKDRTVVVEDRPAYQARVKPWLDACFGPQIAIDKVERNHRFLEEALELVQSTGITQHEAHQLVDYVFNQDIGEPDQEVGGVMNTLAALCLAHGLDMHEAGERELARVWRPETLAKIREKQKRKPKHGPLPGASS